LGLSGDDLKKFDLDKQSPEVKKLLEEAKLAAKRAGEDRTQAAKNQVAPKVAPSARGGAIKA
jgi:hypothetical protein